MRRKWIIGPAFLTGLLLLATVDSQGQPPGFGGRDGGDRGRSGFGRGGFSMDPNQMWDRMSRGQDSINLNDPQNSFMKRMIERRGEPLPPNGILTKQQFVAGMQARMAQSGTSGPSGGSPGRFTPPGGGSSNSMTFQATPGSDGKPVIMMGGQPGMGGNPSDMADSFFKRRDENGDGRITQEEAGRRWEQYQRYDVNRDGSLDMNEYRPMISQMMGGGGGDRGSNNSFDPRNNSMAYQYQNSQSRDSRDSRNQNDDEKDVRPEVHRFGKLPKGLPSWFQENDTDQDGQVGLYEWRRASKPTAEFVELDLNDDGYLTAGEWLRHEKLAIEKRAKETESVSTSSSSSGPAAERGSRTRGGDQGNREKGGERPRRGGGGRNPFTGN